MAIGTIRGSVLTSALHYFRLWWANLRLHRWLVAGYRCRVRGRAPPPPRPPALAAGVRTGSPILPLVQGWYIILLWKIIKGVISKKWKTAKFLVASIVAQWMNNPAWVCFLHQLHLISTGLKVGKPNSTRHSHFFLYGTVRYSSTLFGNLMIVKNSLISRVTIRISHLFSLLGSCTRKCNSQIGTQLKSVHFHQVPDKGNYCWSRVERAPKTLSDLMDPTKWCKCVKNNDLRIMG